MQGRQVRQGRSIHQAFMRTFRQRLPGSVKRNRPLPFDRAPRELKVNRPAG